MKIDSELLKILACPACKSSVVLKEEFLECENPACRLRYPVRDGIPVMLIEEARKN